MEAIFDTHRRHGKARSDASPPRPPADTVARVDGDGTDPLELVAGAIAAGGGCVARGADGRVVFVRHCLPGEKVVAQVTAATASYLRADAIDVLEPSPDRVVPPCPHAGPGRCGGCDWQHIALPAQRGLKTDLVAEQLRRLAGVDRRVEVEEVAGAVDGLGWRTRVRFAVDDQGRAGLRKHRSHQLVLVERCLIACPGVEAVGAESQRWPAGAEVEVTASSDGSERVVSVSRPERGRPTAGAGRPRRSPGGGQPGRRTAARDSGVPDVDASLVVDRRLVRGPGAVHHLVLGRSFRVTAGVFWQVHPGGAEALARAVLDGLAPKPGERVVDLYAGAGLFAALLGQAVGPNGSVVAVESQKQACADATANTADQPQVTVLTGSVDRVIPAGQVGRPDLVVLDPPRAGASHTVIDWLSQARPRRVAYVACDPASFARDLRRLLDTRWAVVSLRAFDLFPMTEHVELVATLEPPQHPAS